MSQHPNLLRQRKSVGTSLLNVHAAPEDVSLNVDPKPTLASIAEPIPVTPSIDATQKESRYVAFAKTHKVKLLIGLALGVVLLATAIALGTVFSMNGSTVREVPELTDPAAQNIVEGDAYSNLVAGTAQYMCLQDCQSGDSIFVTLNAANQVQCAALKGGCIWYRGAGCNRLDAPPTNAVLNTCTSYSDSKHWCNEGRAQLVYARSLCGKTIIGPLRTTTTTTVQTTPTPKTGWQCISSCKDLGNSIFVKYQDNRIVCAGPTGDSSRCVWYADATCGKRTTPSTGNDANGVLCPLNNSPADGWCDEGWKQLVQLQKPSTCSPTTSIVNPSNPTNLPASPYHAVHVPQIPIKGGSASNNWWFARSNSWVLDNLINSPDWGYYPDGHIPVLPVDSRNPGMGWMHVWSEWRNLLTVSNSPYLETARGNSGFNLGGDKLKQELIGQWNSGGMWIMSVWRLDANNPNRIIGFFHAEDRWTLSDLKVYKSIGIAYSYDNGKTFSNPQLVLKHWLNKPPQAEWSGLGDLDVIWDDDKKRWFCIFTDNTGRMSAGISTDPGAAPGSWRKYYNGGTYLFSTNKLTK